MPPSKKQLLLDKSYYQDVLEDVEKNRLVAVNEILECPMCGVDFRRTNIVQKYCSPRCGKHFADLREKLLKYNMIPQKQDVTLVSA